MCLEESFITWPLSMRMSANHRLHPPHPSPQYIATSMSDTTSSCVQSSAYLHVFMDNRSEIEFPISLLWILKSSGDITEPCGTPAGHGLTDNRVLASLTCCLLPPRKLRIHSQKALFTFISASLRSTIPWSTRSNALRKLWIMHELHFWHYANCRSH
jgi:hypothetical protein